MRHLVICSAWQDTVPLRLAIELRVQPTPNINPVTISFIPNLYRGVIYMYYKAHIDNVL